MSATKQDVDVQVDAFGNQGDVEAATVLPQTEKSESA